MNSTFMLGSDDTTERAFGELVGGDARRFLALAQRCIWGTTQPDLVKVNVEKARQQLVKEFPDCPASHLVDALVLLSTGRRDEATVAMERGRAFGPAHPLASLYPTDTEWACEAPATPLVEVVPGTMWRQQTWMPAPSCPLLLPTIMTVLRTDDGELFLYNPGAIDDARAEALAALGPVRWAFHSSDSHNRFVASTAERYPDAAHLGVDRHRDKPGGDALNASATEAPLPEGLERLAIRGSASQDVQLFHPATKTLLCTHLVRHYAPGEPSFYDNLYGFAWGAWNRTAWLGYQVFAWQDLRALQESLRGVLAWDFERVVGAHHAVGGETGEIVQGFRDLLQWTVDLDPREHRRMWRSYFWQQPMFLVDLVRFMLKNGG